MAKPRIATILSIFSIFAASNVVSIPVMWMSVGVANFAEAARPESAESTDFLDHTENAEGIDFLNGLANSLVQKGTDVLAHTENVEGTDFLNGSANSLVQHEIGERGEGAGGTRPGRPCEDCTANNSVADFGSVMGAMGASPMTHTSSCGSVRIPKIQSPPPRADHGDCQRTPDIRLGCYDTEGNRCQQGTTNCQCYIPKGGACHPDYDSCDGGLPCRPGTKCTIVQDPDPAAGATRHRGVIATAVGYRQKCGICQLEPSVVAGLIPGIGGVRTAVGIGSDLLLGRTGNFYGTG